MNTTEPPTNQPHTRRDDTTTHDFPHGHDPESVGVFLQRVGKIPLVSGVVRAYERGKDTSKMVRYGADLVESSVNSLSDTVVSKVGPERIAQIDRYAGAALDRLGQFNQPQQATTQEIHHHHHHYHHYYHHLGYHHSNHFNPHQSSYRHASALQLSSCPSKSSNPYLTHDDQVSDYSDSTESFHQHRPQLVDHPFQTSDDHLHHIDPYHSPRSHTLVQVSTTTTTSGNSKSRWQNILVGAGMTAGGIGAAVSEESMKSLQYCLHWLHYATAHLDHQITVLRNFISSLDEEEEKEEESLTYGMKAMEAATRLAGIKKEVVDTIRKVVDVVSKYARVGLPEPAKEFVRKSILGLPLRWASAIRVTPFIKYSSNMNSGERNLSPLETSQSQSRLSPKNISHPTTQFAAHRVLTFAIESLNMLKSITETFSESVERADAWVQRLRSMGFQNRNDQHPGHPRHAQRQSKSKSNLMDMEQYEELETSNGMRRDHGGEPNLMDTTSSKPRSSSLEPCQQIPRIRSRSSSRSSGATFEEDSMSFMSEKSMMSSTCGCDMSTVGSGSLISSNNTTTATPFCTSHNNQLIYQHLAAVGPVDRSTAKRRKANGNPHPVIIDAHSSFPSPSKRLDYIETYRSSSCDDNETTEDEEAGMWQNRIEMETDHLPHSEENQASQPPGLVDPLKYAKLDQHSSSSPSLLNTPSSSLNLTHSKSLKKLLLDNDQVHHLDLQLSHSTSSPSHRFPSPSS